MMNKLYICCSESCVVNSRTDPNPPSAACSVSCAQTRLRLDVSYLCFSQNVSVLDGEALCGGKGVLRVLRKSGGYLGDGEGHLTEQQ